MDEMFLKRAEAYMKEQHMVKQGDGVIVGISGGADSVCLLSVLCALREAMGLSLYGVHIHHGIRGHAADEDEQFVTALCERLSVPLSVQHYDVPKLSEDNRWSLEEAGRNCRYEAFELERLRRRAQVIAVAHHRDDQAETVLMNLMRGSGPKGLSGMRPVRGAIVRPLLWAGREEILSWLSEQGLSWQEDETNQEDAYSRNRVRHDILPRMEAWNAQAASHIAAAAGRIGQLQDYVEQQAALFLRQHAVEGIMVPVAALAAQHPALRQEVLRQMIPGGLRNVTEQHILQAEALLFSQTGKQAMLPGGRAFYREYEYLYCVKAEEPLGNTAAAQAEEEEERKAFSDLQLTFTRFPKPEGENIKFPENPYTKWFDCDKIKDNVLLRPRQTGDYIVLPGGKHKTVKAYMIDEKIPQRERGKVPVLADGSHVLWIVGCRISEACKVTPETKEILQVEITGGSYHE